MGAPGSLTIINSATAILLEILFGGGFHLDMMRKDCLMIETDATDDGGRYSRDFKAFRKLEVGSREAYAWRRRAGLSARLQA